MRGRRAASLLLLAGAAALAGACTVEVDGAPCRATADCPAGQACGNDLRCSARALACQASRCTPGTGGACLDPSGAPSTALAHRCTDADPVCGAWVDEACLPAGLRCELRAPAGRPVGAWCVCPPLPPAPGGPELAVRPEGSAAETAPCAPGAAAPAACAFRRLGDALAAAAAFVADPGTDPGAVATVAVAGAAGGATRTFSAAATGESFPLVVPERVALRSDAGVSGGAYEIVFDAAGLASAPVELHAGGALAGFTVRNAAADATRDALLLVCDGRAAPPRLASVVLDGRGAGSARLRRGLLAGGSCGLAAAGLEVRDMSGAGILVESLAGSAQVTLAGGSVHGCGEGVVVRARPVLGAAGRVVLDGVRVAGNAGMGIRADDVAGAPRLEVRNAKVVGNGDTGLAVANAVEVRVTGTTVYANGAATIWGGIGLSGYTRRAGGLVLEGDPPAAGAFELGGNRIYANQGDQVLVFGVTTDASTWNLDGPACGTGSPTHVGCYDPDAVATPVSYRGLVALDTALTARNLAWGQGISTVPAAARDYALLNADPSLVGTVNPGCLDPGAIACGSEDPP
jgi:hypothetical protein